MNGNRKQFARWKHITSRLKQGHPLTASTLASELEVSVRTIQRDLDALRDDCGAPIEYDPSRRTLFLTESDWQLQPLRLTESELFHLVIAGGMAGQFHGTPIARGLERLFHKLEAALDEPIDLDIGQLGGRVSFHGTPARPFHPKLWKSVVKALRQSRRLRIKYRAVGYRRPAEFTVEPLHLSCRRGDWYLLASRPGKEDPRVYALSRIQSARILHQTSKAPDSRAHSQKTFARFVAGKGLEPTKVRIRFNEQAAEWVREREWHPEQTITEHRDGGLTLAMPIDGTKEAVSWALSWGSSARVLAPKWLKERVLEEARGILRSAEADA